MDKKTVVLIGATGLVGSHLLQLAENDPDIGLIKVLSRRSIPYTHPKIQLEIIDFSDLDAFRSVIMGSDIVFSCVGTTNKKVDGDKEAYRKVDYDFTVNAAKFCAEAGCSQFAFVSALGANSQSNNFYLQLKGQIEDEINQMKIDTISIFRPSFLLGDRKEFRLGERIGILLMKPVSFLLPSRMKPIKARTVAESMLAATKSGRKGIGVYHYKEMKRLIDEHYPS